jgi:hypothetical protein
MKQLMTIISQFQDAGNGVVLPEPFTPTNPRQPRVSPSLRLRASATNRLLLRWMRAVELAAWKDADSSPRRALKLFP